MKMYEPVELGENWIAVRTHDSFKWRPANLFFGKFDRIEIKHRCNNDSAVIHKMQKNTHKRHGIRYRCSGCKAIAPKRVLFFIKLHKLHEKVS